MADACSLRFADGAFDSADQAKALLTGTSSRLCYRAGRDELRARTLTTVDAVTPP